MYCSPVQALSGPWQCIFACVKMLTTYLAGTSSSSVLGSRDLSALKTYSADLVSLSLLFCVETFIIFLITLIFKDPVTCFEVYLGYFISPIV